MLFRSKPEYYAFFDDDIIYDSGYCGNTNEDQNIIQDRIKESLRPSTQYVYRGIETSLIKKEPITEKKHFLSPELGSMSLLADSIPGWKVSLLSGEITGSVLYVTSSNINAASNQEYWNIPVINLKPIEYKTAINSSPETQYPTMLSNLTIPPMLLDDGNYFHVVEDMILVQAEESNCDLEKENFNIEIFEISQADSNTDNAEILKPLYFANQKKSFIKNNVLLEEDEIISIKNSTPEINSSNIEYYFEILIDTDEIDKNLIYNLAQNRVKDILVDENIELDIDTSIGSYNANSLYDSSVKPEDLKDC